MSVSQHRVSGQFHLSHPEHNADSCTLPVLIFFEHIITTDHEINLFWKRKFSGAVVLFLTNRYLILGESVLLMVIAFHKSVTDEVSLTDLYVDDSLWANIIILP